jgi:phage tail sheath gpL-like
MADLQAPIINWQVMAGDSKAGFGEQRILLIAQATGEAVAKGLLEDVQQTEIETLCGANSMATMAYNRIKKYNKANEIDIIPLAEPVGATKAQGGISVTGTASENKTLNFKVGDDAFEFSATVIKDETAGEVAIKIMNAINAKNYPFTASIDAGDTGLVLIDFDIAGEVANGITSRINTRVLGLSFSVVQFTGGAGAYDVDGIFDNVNKRYQTVLFDSAMNFDAVEEWLESRVNMSNTVKGGSGITMMNGSYTTVKNFANSKNSKTMVVIGNVDEMKYNALPLLATAEFGAKRALRLTDGAVIGSLVVEAQEAFGGINKSSLPYHNTPMSYDQPKNELIIEQVQDLNDAGVSLFVPATIGVVLGTMVTLYKYDNTGIEDKTFKYLNAVDTSLAVQEYLFVNSQKEFGQTRATGGDLVAGVAMTNTVSVKAYIVGLYEDMVAMALVQGGAEAIKSFKKTLTVSLDVASGIYSVYAPTAIVSQFRGLSGVVAIGYEFN